MKEVNGQWVPFDGRWIPWIRPYASYGNTFEAHIVREDNEHGRESCGWVGPAKILIAEGHCTKTAWKALGPHLQKMAERLAEKYNREDEAKKR